MRHSKRKVAMTRVFHKTKHAWAQNRKKHEHCEIVSKTEFYYEVYLKYTNHMPNTYQYW